MATTARTIITGALGLCGVLNGSEAASGDMAQDGLRRLNLMMNSLTVQPLSIPVISREVFDMTSGKGSPTNPYTIGSGGNLNTTRPPKIVGVGLLQNPGAASEVEIPRSIFTNDMYEAIQVKTLTNALFTGLWYKPTNPLGRIYLWPVPDVATNDLVLYLPQQLSEFTDLTTSYDLPPGTAEALEYNLAERLWAIYWREKPVPSPIAKMARSSLGVMKRSNVIMTDLQQDPALTHTARGGYNIETGQ